MNINDLLILLLCLVSIWLSERYFYVFLRICEDIRLQELGECKIMIIKYPTKIVKILVINNIVITQ